MVKLEEIDRIHQLAALGWGPSRIAHELGIPRHRARYWSAHRPVVDFRRAPKPELALLSARHYAYLLGLYLGDGHLAKVPRSYQLRIALDTQYPAIIQEAVAALRAVLPTRSVMVVPHRTHRCTRLLTNYVHWPVLLPQHGEGPKHARRIVLAGWQRQITDEQPRALIRGLIHSDGCRFVAAQVRGDRTYRYPRYCFSNRSEDIHAIFCEHLELLGIRWTRPSSWQVQIARRDDVAALDAFVGPKR